MKRAALRGHLFQPPTAMPSSLSTIQLFAANLLIPIAILIFASGFFPYKAFLPGLAQYDGLDLGEPPKAVFDKVVFMVVDALRSDFVYSEDSGFAFTQSLISNGMAIPFTAHATSPTITMPRIKAITTGSIPSFLDVILNFAESDTTSTLATQDTWLAQMKAKQTGKLVMYGDDTWIKLFPESFARSDGTSSFFVAEAEMWKQDFTEVDNNVTRHVPEELQKDDWNTIILHYLGLDHIGHKAGPRSRNMIPKQREMDSIVRQIFQALESQEHLSSTLLVLCGDHGMNDAGNHGGSSPGETSPALVFLSPRLKAISSAVMSPVSTQNDFQYYTTVEQSDIAPTLAALLGFPIPRNNLGAFIVDFLAFWPESIDKIQILLQNAKQILSIVTATFSHALFECESSLDCSIPDSDVKRLGCSWCGIKNMLDKVSRDGSGGVADETILAALSKWSRDAQEIMSSTASNYDMTKLLTGTIVALLASVFVLSASLMSPGLPILPALPLLSVSVTYGIMMFASSYVEEEHHFWYWMTSSWVMLLYLKRDTKEARAWAYMAVKIVILLCTLRMVRRWNQTGQKYAGGPDIARTFLPKHKNLLWSLVYATYLWNICSLVIQGTRISKMSRIARATLILASALLFGAGLTFKLAFTNEDAPELLDNFARLLVNISSGSTLVTRARMVFLGLGLGFVYAIYEILSSKDCKQGAQGDQLWTIHHLIVLFLMTQSRASNIPLLLIFEIQFHLLRRLHLSPLETSITTLLLQHMSFFAFGGTNAISSIDLSSAYNGVSGYNVLAVGLLTLVSNWAGPIYWTSATSIILASLQQKGGRARLQNHLIVLTLFMTCSLCFVMVACTVLRTHLFIWTVFSPKYLYSMAWAFGQHLLINAGLGSILFGLGTR